MTRKNTFFEGWSWSKFNNLRLALGTNLKFYTSVAKRLKLKVKTFCGLISTFVKLTGEKLVEGTFVIPPPILQYPNFQKPTLPSKIHWVPRVTEGLFIFANMTGFWICVGFYIRQSSEIFRTLNISWFLICNSSKYAWIYLKMLE